MRRRAAWAVVALLLIAGGVWRVRRRPDALLAQLAAGPTRPLEARLASAALDRPRPFASGTAVSLATLAALEGRGSPRVLAEAQLIAGRDDDAARSLARAGSDNRDAADIALDRAAIALARGEPDEALRAADVALARAAGRPAAHWNRALALAALDLPLAAAASFDAVAAAGEPGWADEARGRARALRDELARRKADAAAFEAAGAKLLADGTPLPAELVRTYDGTGRRWLYDAVRAAPSVERVRALRPLAVTLDERAGGTVLASYVDAVAHKRFAVRAALAKSYADALTRPLLTVAAAEAWLQSLARAGSDADDILLGAYMLVGRPAQHLADYVRLARVSRNPWFTVLALQFTATAERAHDNLAGNERDVRAAIDAATAPGLSYRWLRVANSWGEQLVTQMRLQEARLLAQKGLQCAAREDFETERSFIIELGECATRAGDDSLANAYLDEGVERAEDRCSAERHAYESKAWMAHTELRFDDARRLLAATPTCEPGRFSQLGAGLAADLQRVDRSPVDRATLEATLKLLLENPNNEPTDHAYAEGLQGRALAHFDRARAELLLRHAVAEAETMPRTNSYGRAARAIALSELAFIAAADGRWDDAIGFVAQHVEVHAPARCLVAVALDDERLLTSGRDALGHSFGRLGRRSAVIPPPSELVPDDLRARLADCAEVHLLALPPLNGRPTVLPPELAWSYGAGGQAASPPTSAPRRLVVADVTPPPSLGLPPLQPYVAPAGRSDRVMRGAAATPARVMAELADADEIELDVHGLIDLAVSDASMLVLSPDGQGRWALNAAELRQLHLTRAPLVVLGACNAAQPSPGMHDAWSLPQAFVVAGARAVLASGAPVPDADSGRFFDDVLARIHQGAAPAVALRDARVSALRAGHSWVRDVMLFE